MRKLLAGLLVVLLLSIGLSGIGFAEEERVLNMYFSAAENWGALLAEKFEEYANCRVDWIRMSSSETYARLKAESANPRGDVWVGGTLDPHTVAADEGLTEAYQPSNWDEQIVAVRDPVGDLRVLGMYSGVLGFAVNVPLLEAEGIAIPQSWEDLLDPNLKGYVGMANPNTSGTALTTVGTLIQVFGEDEAFEYMKKLHQNIGVYTKSGAAPGVLVGRGELGVCIIFLHDVIKHAEWGYPVTPVVPEEGTGFEIGGLNLITGAPHPELAKQFIDWVLSAEAQELMPTVKSYQLPTNMNAIVPEVAQKIFDDAKDRLIAYDFTYVGENALRWMERWTAEVYSQSR